MILTITAPIRVPAKTAAALEDKIRTYLVRRSVQVEDRDTIHGNQIRVRLVKGGSRRTPKVIGFVHNPDSDPGVVLDITHSLIERIGAKARKGTPADLRAIDGSFSPAKTGFRTSSRIGTLIPSCPSRPTSRRF